MRSSEFRVPIPDAFASRSAPPAGADRADRPAARCARGGRGRGSRRPLQALDRRSDHRPPAPRHPQGGALALARGAGYALRRSLGRHGTGQDESSPPRRRQFAQDRLDKILGREKWPPGRRRLDLRRDLRRQRRPRRRVRHCGRRLGRHRRLELGAHGGRSPGRSRRLCRWPRVPSSPSAPRPSWPRPTSRASARRSPSTPRRRRRSSRSSTSSRESTRATADELAEQLSRNPEAMVRGARRRGIRWYAGVPR